MRSRGPRIQWCFLRKRTRSVNTSYCSRHLHFRLTTHVHLIWNMPVTANSLWFVYTQQVFRDVFKMYHSFSSSTNFFSNILLFNFQRKIGMIFSPYQRYNSVHTKLISGHISPSISSLRGLSFPTIIPIIHRVNEHARSDRFGILWECSLLETGQQFIASPTISNWTSCCLFLPFTFSTEPHWPHLSKAPQQK